MSVRRGEREEREGEEREGEEREGEDYLRRFHLLLLQG